MDCGQTWSKAVNISEEQRVSQSAAIAIDPRTGAVYVAWRRFMTAKQNDAIMIAKADADDFEFSDRWWFPRGWARNIERVSRPLAALDVLHILRAITRNRKRFTV